MTDVETDRGTRLVAAARGWIGTPYVHQASCKGAGADCLGLVRGVWREIQAHPPRTATDGDAGSGTAGGADHQRDDEEVVT